jgi:hypothetical protein
MEIPIPIDGVIPDADPRTIQPTGLVDARNYVIRDGALYNRPGLVNRFSASNGTHVAVNGTGVFFIHDPKSGTTFDVIATGSNSIVYAGGVSIDTGTLSSTAPTVFRVFDKGSDRWVLIANGTDPLKKWIYGAGTFSNVGTGDGDGPDDSEDEPGKPQCIMVLATRLLACGFPAVAGKGALVRVSDALDFDNGWFPVTQETLLVDTQGDIVACMEMGTLRGAIYKDTSIWMVTAGSDSLAPFTFELVHDGVSGPASRTSVCVGPTGEHFYQAQDGGLYVFDGTRAREFLPKFKSMARAILDYGQATVTRTPWIAFDARHNELVCGIGYLDTSTTQWVVRVRLDNGSLWPMEYTTDDPFLGACYHPEHRAIVYAVPDAAAVREATFFGSAHAFGINASGSLSTDRGYADGAWDFDLDSDLTPSSHLSAVAITSYARWGMLRPDPGGTTVWSALEAEMEWDSTPGQAGLGAPTATVAIAGSSHYAWRGTTDVTPKIPISSGHTESSVTQVTLTGVTPERVSSWQFGMRETGRFFMVKLDSVTNPVNGGANSTTAADFSFRGGRAYMKQRGRR